jgi:hypothetical protein
MGVDRSLLPVEGHGAVTDARTGLKGARRPGLLAALLALESLFSRDGAGDGPRDGRPLLQLVAGERVALAGHPEGVDNATNRAAWACLAPLPAA